jgi:hypothetical protein
VPYFVPTLGRKPSPMVVEGQTVGPEFFRSVGFTVGRVSILPVSVLVSVGFAGSCVHLLGAARRAIQERPMDTSVLRCGAPRRAALPFACLQSGLGRIMNQLSYGPREA